MLWIAEHVFVLDAPDDLLIKRVQALPESTAEKLQCTQDEFMSRLNNYRQLRGAEETVLDFFDHREIHPEHIGTVNRAMLDYRN